MLIDTHIINDPGRHWLASGVNDVCFFTGADMNMVQKELKAQVQACLSLGLLYSEAKEPEKSADLLEQHFELSRQLGERNVLDAARVILGVARGTDQMATFQEAVNTQNIYKLLKWKTDRRPLIEDS
eukprot:GHVQ01004468.1.p1 GENE.GHVQ01004468.1~~GHVQ01004468.1.p1  ORF type:complete len:127 (+),score=8.52 GHVQ01004468.1:500-880(+)